MATLLVMENKVRRNLGDKTSPSSGVQRYNQTLIRDLINEAYLYYAAMMIDSGEGDFCETRQTIDIVAYQQEYDLATLLTFIPVKLRLVERKYSNIRYVLKKWEKNDGSVNENGMGAGFFFPTYRFVGTKLCFNMVPNFSETATISIEGYRAPDEMVNDSDTPASGFLNLYQNLLILYATIGALESKEASGMAGDPEMFRRRLEKQEAIFIETMNNRTASRESVDPFVPDEEEGWL